MYGKHFIGSAIKAIGSGIAGGLLLWASQQWLTSDLEYTKMSRDAYISATLGQQGLSMAYGGDSLKNVSVVEFALLNRTQRQLTDIDIVFSVNAPAPSIRLVSSGLIPPQGYPVTEAIEEIAVKDPLARKYRLKVVPRYDDERYFHGVFVFDGDKAPEMKVVSVNKDVSVIEFAEWKDRLRVSVIVLTSIAAFYVVLFVVGDMVAFFNQPKRHRRMVEKFKAHAGEVYGIVPLERADETSISDAARIYGSFIKPRESKIWTKFFGPRHFD